MKADDNIESELVKPNALSKNHSPKKRLLVQHCGVDDVQLQYCGGCSVLCWRFISTSEENNN